MVVDLLALGNTKIATRPATDQDTLFLEDLFADVNRHEFAPLNLSSQMLDGLLKMQARAQKVGYGSEFPEAVDRLILKSPKQDGVHGEPQDQPVGRIFLHTDDRNIHLVDIAILPEFQRQGLGTSLLTDVLALSDKYGLATRLSVRPHNSALRLYLRLGFVVTCSDYPLQMARPPLIRGPRANFATPRVD